MRLARPLLALMLALFCAVLFVTAQGCASAGGDPVTLAESNAASDLGPVKAGCTLMCPTQPGGCSLACPCQPILAEEPPGCVCVRLVPICPIPPVPL